MKDQWIEWLQDRQRHFFYGIASVLALLFIASQFLGHKKTQSSSDYIRANQAFQSWIEQKDDLQPLSEILQDRPDLETKFGALVASRLILQDQADEAKPFADRVFERVLRQTPQHATFAEGSLLIAQGSFRDALACAVNLKDKLEKSSLLYGFNLMRIASLYRELAANDQEIAALEDLHEYLSAGHEATTQFSRCFSHGNVSLIDYISNRKSR